MRRSLLFLVLVSMSLLALVGCNGEGDVNELAPPPVAPQYSVLGTWRYTLIAESGDSSTEYDTGTITFDGTETGGAYSRIDFYEIEYNGDYLVNGEEVTITGSEVWTGALTDATHMGGTWETPDGEARGTWTAVKQ